MSCMYVNVYRLVQDELEASVRQDPGWGGVEVCRLVLGDLRVNFTEFEFVAREEIKDTSSNKLLLFSYLSNG